MQKSKYISISILIIILIYSLLSQFCLKSLGNTYTYIINVIFFVAMVLVVKFTITPPYKSSKHKKKILTYVIIAVLIYSLTYLLSGIFVTYGKNPYSQSMKGILLNLYSTGLIILCREYIRYVLVNSVFQKDKKLIMILTVIVFSIQEMDINLIITAGTAYYVFKVIFETIVPNIIKNSLFTYIAASSDYVPAVVYDLSLCLLQWIPEILPNTPWIFNSIIKMMVPLILLLYCMYEVNSKNKVYIYKQKKVMKPKGLIPITAVIVLVIWFGIGILPIKPIVIMTGSMSPNLEVGDIVISKKSSITEIEENDVLEFRRENKIIVHRAIKKYEKNGKTYIVTKGDNNENVDFGEVTEEELKGKVILRIPYAGWPVVWFNNLNH